MAEAGVHTGREPSGKTGRKQDKKDASGEGGKEKKEKKKAAASGAGRVKNKPSPQNAPMSVEPIDGSVACLLSSFSNMVLHEYFCQYFGDK